jgi:hypothetical protein
MDFFSLGCYNDRVPGTRSFEGWNDWGLCLGDFLLIVMGTNEIRGFIEVIYYRVKSVKYEDYE